MMTRRRFLVLAGSAAPVAVAVGLGIQLLPGDDSGSDVPTIRWDDDVCAHCGMVISDTRYAAAWIEPGGRQLRFDDIGCLVQEFATHTPGDGTRLFARDFAEDRWLDATTAVYLHSDDLRSPMAYGIAAFESEAAGRIDVHGDARVLRWHDVLNDLPGRAHHEGMGR